MNDENLTLQSDSGKGRHWLASKDIPKGFCVLAENPVFSINEELKQNLIEQLKLPVLSTTRKFVGAMYDFYALDKQLSELSCSSDSLCEEELELMQSLEEKNPGLLKRYLILSCNSFELLNDERDRNCAVTSVSTTTALYIKASFFNHSCQPNCSYTFNLESGEVVISATKDISANEELTIGYTLCCEADPDEDEDDQTVNTTNTRELFRRKYGVDCNCGFCS